VASSVRTTLRAFEDSWTVQVNQDSRIQTDTHTRAHTHIVIHHTAPPEMGFPVSVLTWENKLLYCVVCSAESVDFSGTPSLLTIKIPSTPRWLWMRFNVSSTSDACAGQ